MFDLDKEKPTYDPTLNADNVIDHFLRSGEPYIEGMYLVSGDGKAKIGWKWLLLNAKRA